MIKMSTCENTYAGDTLNILFLSPQKNQQLDKLFFVHFQINSTYRRATLCSTKLQE